MYIACYRATERETAVFLCMLHATVWLEGVKGYGLYIRLLVRVWYIQACVSVCH